MFSPLRVLAGSIVWALATQFAAPAMAGIVDGYFGSSRDDQGGLADLYLSGSDVERDVTLRIDDMAGGRAGCLRFSPGGFRSSVFELARPGRLRSQV